MRFTIAAWRPGERYKVYGGSSRPDCMIYTRDCDADQVGHGTGIVGPYDELEAFAVALNEAVGFSGGPEPEVQL